VSKIPRLEFFAPKTLAEALNTSAKWGGDAKLLAGGTDLLVQMKQGTIRPKRLMSLHRVRGLTGIDRMDSGLKIGAMTPLWDVEHSAVVREQCAPLAMAASEIGSPAIRQVATIGGNLCNASPAADTAPSLFVSEAELYIQKKEGEKRIPVADFFRGPAQTSLDGGEILTSIFLPPLPSMSRSLYLRLGRKSKADLALVGMALVLAVDSDGKVIEIRIGLGGVAPTPIRAKRAEELARDKVLNPSWIKKVAEQASEESQPISDIRGSADYKKAMVAALVSKGLRQLSSNEERP